MTLRAKLERDIADLRKRLEKLTYHEGKSWGMEAW